MRVLVGKTVLAHVVERVKSCRLVDEVIVATTEAAIDDVIANESEKNDAIVFRGSEEDVLSRYYLAARQLAADVVVRVTSDCPLFDGGILFSMLDLFLGWNRPSIIVDYLSNSLHRSFPRGLDTEIFTFSTLEQTHREAVRSYEREHVTPYIYGHPELFRIREFTNSHDLSAHRWTLDTLEDWNLIEAIYRELGSGGDSFSTSDVLDLLAKRPCITQMNAHVEQKKLH